MQKLFTYFQEAPIRATAILLAAQLSLAIILGPFSETINFLVGLSIAATVFSGVVLWRYIEAAGLTLRTMDEEDKQSAIRMILVFGAIGIAAGLQQESVVYGIAMLLFFGTWAICAISPFEIQTEPTEG